MQKEDFDALCKSLIDVCRKLEKISDTDIRELSFFAADTIRSSSEFPKSFFDLRNVLGNYWRDTAKLDADRIRAFSYIRAFQICCIADTVKTVKTYEDRR